jgi:Recombination endonuclease VII
VKTRNYAAANAKRREREKAALGVGLCVRCLTETIRPGRMTCQACADRLERSRVKHVGGRLARGLCRCGAEPRTGRKSCEKCKLRGRFTGAKTTYQLTSAQTARHRAATVCELCGRPPKPGKALCVDHHHGTGLFRGILCKSCNTMLGLGQDDPRMLRKAAEYLERSGLCVF